MFISILIAWTGLWALTTDVLEHDTILQPTEDEIDSLLDKHAQAYMEENISLLAATLHPASPRYNTTLIAARKMFDQQTLFIQIENTTILSRNSTTAVVQVQHTVRSSPPYQDSRINSNYTLKPHHKEWLIYDFNTGRIQPLD